MMPLDAPLLHLDDASSPAHNNITRTVSRSRSFRLSPPDHNVLGAIIESALRVATPREFIQWTRGPLQLLLPHGMLVCALIEIDAQGLRIHKLLGHRFPLQYLEDMRRLNGGLLSPALATWWRDGRPQLFNSTTGGSAKSARRALFDKYDLRNIAAHGMRDLRGNAATWFNFSRIPESVGPRHAHLLELLMPHMHVALTRALSHPRVCLVERNGERGITVRERAILRLLREGKTNKEISQIADRSEHTVNNQVRSIFVKLVANNRAQAVAKAIDLGLLG